jgi:hypothetical protein
MKAFLISPDHANQCAILSTIHVAQNPAGVARLEHLYHLLDCRLVQFVEPRAEALAGHLMIIDEEGLLKPHAGYLFMPRLYPAPLAGKVIIAACGDGEQGQVVMKDPTVDEHVVRDIVKTGYCSPRFARIALRMHEDAIRRVCPEAIVIPASEYIRVPG